MYDVETAKAMTFFIVIFGGTICLILGIMLCHKCLGNKYSLWFKKGLFFRILWPHENR